MGWKTRYSFRLSKEDKKLGEFLSKLPFKSESEAIRQMLLYAYKHINAEHKQMEQINQVKMDLDRFKKLYDKNHAELLEAIQNGDKNINKSNENKGADDDLVQDTASAMLNSFGVDFNE